jgi:hypothetical protein
MMTYSVFVLCPKNSFLGGDPKTKDGPAERYAEHETGICVYRSDYKPKLIKQKSRDFFKKTGEQSRHFGAYARGAYETKHEAQDKCLYEAKMCGHWIPTRYGWIIVEKS